MRVIPLPRMTLSVGFLEVGNRQLCVVLDGVEGLVAEEFLDVVHAGAGLVVLGFARSPRGPLEGHIVKYSD